MFRRSSRLIMGSSESSAKHIGETIHNIEKFIKFVNNSPKGKKNFIAGTDDMSKYKVAEGIKMYSYLQSRSVVMFQGLYFDTFEGKRDKLWSFLRVTYRNTFVLMDKMGSTCTDPLVHTFKRLIIRYRKCYERYRSIIYGTNGWKIELSCELMNKIESYF
jgi:hypothetical protein